MGATVSLRLGDMFEGPTDLMVVPCSTDPTVTSFVRDRLETFDIPVPRGAMTLGEVRVQRFSGAENIAPFVAFAASVRAYTSTPDAIAEIGRQLGAFTRQETAVSEVTAPLLGAGAGQLEPAVVIEQLRDGFLATCRDDTQLRIYIRWPELYESLRDQFGDTFAGGESTRPRHESEPVRVFISYTHSARDPGHGMWVKALAERLRSSGIDARLDVWHRRHTDLVQWMCNELDQADRVLLICNEEYAQKADRRHGGVGWDVRIVQGDIFSQSYISEEAEQDKYVVLVTSEDAYAGLPAFLKTAYHIHWPGDVHDDAKLQELVQQLFRAYEEAPPIGRPPSYVVGMRSGAT